MIDNTYFIWDTGTILFFFILSLFVWLLGMTEDIKKHVKYPKLLGSTAAIASGFEIGFTFIVPLIFFWIFVWLIEYWYKRLQIKGVFKRG